MAVAPTVRSREIPLLAAFVNQRFGAVVGSVLAESDSCRPGGMSARLI